MRRRLAWRFGGAVLAASAIVLWWTLGAFVDPSGNSGMGLLPLVYAMLALAAAGLALLLMSFRVADA